jgi:hypothetical protein
MGIVFKFVNYGDRFEPAADTLVLDVGMKTVPGIIDHHHPEAEPECAASLIVKHPELVLDHVRSSGNFSGDFSKTTLTIITHRLPDFDALAAIFLALRLTENDRVDAAMEKIAAYAKLADSASLPKSIDLTGTPYAILRALFSGSRKSEDDTNRERTEEGLKFMRFLCAGAEKGFDFVENRALYAGIDRYERAMGKIGDDYFHYLDDLGRGQKIRLTVPNADGNSSKKVDGLVLANPRSFLLKEWARRDRDHPEEGDGFTFVMTNFGNARYILGVDPAKGVNLRGLGDFLEARESEKRQAAGRPPGLSWYVGDCPFFNYRIIDSPQDGTSLTHQEILEMALSFEDWAHPR